MAVVVVVAAVGAGWAVRSSPSSGGRARRTVVRGTDGTAPAAPVPVPVGVVSSEWSGFGRSESGARGAALVVAASLPQQAVYMDDVRLHRVLADLRARGARDDDATVLDRLAAIRRRLGAAGPGAVVWLSISPVGVRVDAYTPVRARVSVWTVTVVSAAGSVAPQTTWRTSSVELVWDRGGWRLWSSVDAPGPSPTLDGSDEPATGESFDAAMRGFGLVKEHR
ncbi:MAG: hypothetical protein HYX34_11120 [Actinobacteria bacterium]|nr:hypothetical protein [Actinomycetota bacterium]